MLVLRRCERQTVVLQTTETLAPGSTIVFHVLRIDRRLGNQVSVGIDADPSVRINRAGPAPSYARSDYPPAA